MDLMHGGGRQGMKRSRHILDELLIFFNGVAHHNHVGTRASHPIGGFRITDATAYDEGREIFSDTRRSICSLMGCRAPLPASM